MPGMDPACCRGAGNHFSEELESRLTYNSNNPFPTYAARANLIENSGTKFEKKYSRISPAKYYGLEV